MFGEIPRFALGHAPRPGHYPLVEADSRFGGIQRLYSAAALERLRAAHVCVVGIGGVGSWAVEALARSGIGHLTLVDLDDVCVSNINRQLHALEGTIGRPKVEVMAERARAINPACQTRPVTEFFTAETSDAILAHGFDYLVDCIDNVPNKCLLIARARDRQIPLVTTGAAGGRRDSLALRLADLAETTHDALLAQVRKRLRDEFGFPSEPGKPFGVPCIFSPEPPARPSDCAPGSHLRLDCESGYGTASFVTGAFGLAAAGHVVSALAHG